MDEERKKAQIMKELREGIEFVVLCWILGLFTIIYVFYVMIKKARGVIC